METTEEIGAKGGSSGESGLFSSLLINLILKTSYNALIYWPDGCGHLARDRARMYSALWKGRKELIPTAFIVYNL
jgi:hypothetical protein